MIVLVLPQDNQPVGAKTNINRELMTACVPTLRAWARARQLPWLKGIRRKRSGLDRA